MESLKFAEILNEKYPLTDATLIQHLSMFLNGGEREGFFDFIGVEYEEDE